MEDRADPREPGAAQPETAEVSWIARCCWCERPHAGKRPLSVCPACTARFQTMGSLEMSGSYPLTAAAIDAVLTRTSPGNYALGYMEGDAFRVFFVGRSDSDVKQRLHAWVGMPGRYENYASPAKASWGVQSRGGLPTDSPALARVECADASYTRFAFSYAGSAEDAYAKEWRNYDAFGGSHGLDNASQPAQTSSE